MPSLRLLGDIRLRYRLAPGKLGARQGQFRSVDSNDGLFGRPLPFVFPHDHRYECLRGRFVHLRTHAAAFRE